MRNVAPSRRFVRRALPFLVLGLTDAQVKE